MQIVDLTEDRKDLFCVCLEDWSGEAKEVGPKRREWLDNKNRLEAAQRVLDDAQAEATAAAGSVLDQPLETAGARAVSEVEALETKAAAIRQAAWEQNKVRRGLDAVLSGVQGGAPLGGRPQVFSAALMSSGEREVLRSQQEMADNTDRAVLNAVTGDPTMWVQVSGVGDFSRFPQGQFQYPGESRKDAYLARQADMAKLAMNPELLINSLAENTETLRHYAPQVASDIQQTSVRAVEFMSKLGGQTVINNPLQPTVRTTPTDDVSIRNYENYWNATMFPAKLLDELATWSLQAETVMAAQAVHPALFSDVQERMSYLVSTGEFLPNLHQRQQLGGLLGVQDVSETVEFQIAYNGIFEQQAMQQQQQRPPQKPGRASPTLSQQTRTLSQSAGESIGN